VSNSWISIFKKCREDTILNPADRNHVVCELHFNPQKIIQVFQHIIDGKSVTIGRTK